MAFSKYLLLFLCFAASGTQGRGLTTFPDSSLYLLESTWQRDDGTKLQLADLKGEVRIISMFFTDCDNLCPMILGQLESLERAMPENLRTKVGFVLVTMDPKDDSPSALARYRKKSGLSAKQWTLIRGNADDTRELAGLLGVHYTPKQEDGQMGHTGLIAILNGAGKVFYSTQAVTDQKIFMAELARAVKINANLNPN